MRRICKKGLILFLFSNKTYVVFFLLLFFFIYIITNFVVVSRDGKKGVRCVIKCLGFFCFFVCFF